MISLLKLFVCPGGQAVNDNRYFSICMVRQEGWFCGKDQRDLAYQHLIDLQDSSKCPKQTLYEKSFPDYHATGNAYSAGYFKYLPHQALRLGL